MKRALIIGCGYTGAALAEKLVAAGISVVGTTTASHSKHLAPRFGLRTLDLTAAAGQLDLREAAGAVVYYMVSTLERSYLEQGPHLAPMQRCLDALSEQSIEGLIYLSSTSVYGDRQGGWVDERSEVTPGSPWGRMRVELEQAVWSFGRRAGVPACVVRLPEIYGPGRGPVERLARSDHVIRYPQRYSNRIHLDDLVTTLALLGQRRDQPLLLAADSLPATTLEVYQFTADRMGLPLVVGSPQEAPDPNRRALMQESKRCRNARLLSWLGRPLRYPSYHDGITAILGSRPGCG